MSKHEKREKDESFRTLEVYGSKADKRVIERAAKKLRLPRSKFMLIAALEKAERELDPRRPHEDRTAA